MQSEIKAQFGFAQRRLPCLVAGAALVLYIITLNHSATVAGISTLAKAAGWTTWEWRSALVAPLHTIVTFPIRWLPSAIQLPALNLLAAIFASAALGLLARSVALLPHDRTREQRALERSDYSTLSVRAAWLPPVLAAMVCGLQLTFWENAVVATGESLDLFLFAWLIHSLLAYRVDEKESRLWGFAFVYGLAVTNNYAMLAFALPFLVALVWTRGRAFFQLKFLGRLLGWGLAGLSIYLLLPLILTFTAEGVPDFWELLKSYAGYQKDSLLSIPRYVVVLSGFTSVLPVLFIGIRWPAQFGEVSAVGNALANLMTHVIHAVFLVACAYVAFDPSFSPRNLGGNLAPFLTLYYLGALVIGYCSGYFLLVFGPRPALQPWQRLSPLQALAHRTVIALLWLAFLGLPAGLIARNLPVIWANTGKAMSRLSALTAQSLPEGGAYVLSEDSFRLHALQYELLKTNPRHKNVLVQTTALGRPAYQHFLKTRYGERWPSMNPIDPKATIDPRNLLELLVGLRSLSPVYYLHPSFGYYFEYFYAKPHGMVYELISYPTNSISAPALSAAEIKEGDAQWRALRGQELDPLIRKASPFVKPGKGKTKPATLETYLGAIYSRAADYFGVELQRAENLPLAGEYFDLACQLNPANAAAYLNREFNTLLRAGKPGLSQFSEGTMARLEGVGGGFDAILGLNGPFDEPTACYGVAHAFERGSNFRQAAQNLQRTVHFEPDNRPARIALAFVATKAGFPDVGLDEIKEYRARFKAAGLSEKEEVDLISSEAWARVVKNEVPKAEALLKEAQTKYPKQSSPWETMVDIYIAAGQLTNAVTLLDQQLNAQPNSVLAHVNYAALMIKLTNYAAALPHLERALQINPRDEAALMNRAMANFRLDRLDAAQRDYETLLGAGTGIYKLQVLYGLGEIFYRKKNRSEALRHYKDFLNNAPAGLPEVPRVKDRIKLLESGGGF